MTFAEAINAALARSKELAADGPEQKLEREYLRLFRALARDVAAAFDDAVPSVQAAANWAAPSVDEVLAVIVNHQRVRDAQRSMLAAIAGPFAGVEGVDFNLTHPVVQEMLDKLGMRVEGTLKAAVREPVSRVIAEGWAKGLGPRDVAKDIRAAITGVSSYQAMMLARTDLNALSNGSGNWAVQQLNAGAKANREPQPIGSKTWTTAGDGRVRETHQAAEGQTVPIDQPYMVGGHPLKYPGDPFGPSEEVVQCRCVDIYNEPAARGNREDVQAEEGPPAEPKERFLDRLVAPRGDFGSQSANAVAADSVRAIELFDDALPGGMTKDMTDRLEPLGGKMSVRMASDINDGGAHGQYVFVGRSPGQINISMDTPEAYNTTWHELGHFVDHVALGRPGVFTMEHEGEWSAAVRGFTRAADDTSAIQDMRTLRRTEWIELKDGSTIRNSTQTEQMLDYLTGYDEVWARAFAQWMTRTHGDQLARAEHSVLMHRQRNSRWGIQEQWEDDEFELLVPHIEAVLREAGLLDDLGLTAAFWRYIEAINPRLFPPVEGGEPSLSHRPGADEVLDQRDDLLIGPAVSSEGVGVNHPRQSATASSRPGAAVPSLRDSEEVTVPQLKQQLPMMATRRDPASVQFVPVLVAAALDEDGRTRWHSDMCFEGLPTGDGRFMVPGSLRSRELPLTLMAMTETPDFGGHAGAEVAGRIDTFQKLDTDMDGAKLPDGVKAVYSTGVFDQGSFAQDIERMVGDEVLRGISVDLAVFEWAFRDPDTGELIDPMEATDEQWERAFMGELEFAVVEGEVMASTVCPTPAFADARIALLASGLSPHFARTWIASPEYAEQHGVESGQLMTTIVSREVRTIWHTTVGSELTVTAGAAAPPRPGVAPLRPARDSFFRREADGPQPITIEADGTLTGHLALWETCHTGYSNGEFATCVKPPASGSDYSEFHLMPLECADGDQVLVGKLTVGTGHADPHLGVIPARSHYDNTGSVAAYVRAFDGEYGIWLSGATRSDMSDEMLRDLRVNPPSGDWRGPRGALELLAALCVVCPGFPVPQIGLAADAQGVYMQTLILAGGVPIEPVRLDPIEAAVMLAEVRGPEGLDELIQGDCGCE